MSVSPTKENLNIQLGDIIEITAPTNEELNDKFFYIKYLSYDKIILLGQDKKQIILTLNQEGELDDESIESISIINRAEMEGYARQNKLLPGTWIDIYFGGDIPLIITGLISNLENDMIEIKTYPSEEVIYIDFEYKGLPEDLLIEKINIRTAPTIIEDESVEEKVKTLEDLQFDAIEDIDLVKLEMTELRPDSILLDADQIEFGIDLDEVTQVIEVPESEQRYGIDKQTTDMLNELLSTIPNMERTPSKLNEIHKIIERYKELRLEYSIFDPNTNSIEPKILGSNYKPLVESLKKLDKKLYWLLPVSINNKKVYDVEDQDEGVSYIDNLTLAQTLIENSEYLENWKSNQIPEEQSKYTYYLKQINNLATPFTNANLNEFIIEKEVNTDLFTIINNLGDEKSYVVGGNDTDEIKMSRFISQVYNTGLTRLKSDINEDRKIINTLIKATDNDILALKGFLFLSLPTYKFSHINLPTTDILSKSNLNNNFIQYWKFLNNNTIVNNILLDDITKPINWDKNNFLNNVKQILIDDSIDKEQPEIYEKYLDTIIPKTRILFELLKDHIDYDLSFYKIIKYMEPFMIYDTNLSYKQYEEIVNFLNEKIIEYKKDFATNSKKFLQIYNKLVTKESKVNNTSVMFNLLSNDQIISDQVFKAYNISQENKNVTSIELLDKIIRIDNAKLFMSAIAKVSVDLMVSNVIDQFIEIEEKMKKEKLENTECKKYVLSKKYYAIDELEDDNGKEIFFDKKYDNTFYDILNEYKDQQESMAPDQFFEFLTKKLQDNIGLSQIEAERDANAMIKNRRPVITGDYAILEEEGAKNKIYKREGNNWILDTSISDNVFFEGNKFFCESQFMCFEKDKSCIDDKSVTKEIQKKNLKKIMNEFDYEYRLDLQKIKSIIDNNYNYNLEVITKEIKVETKNKLKYNEAFLYLSTLISETDIIVSPYFKLKDYILGQNDFGKKQMDIIQFTLKYTREAYENEDKYWLYCKETNTKLLPKFLYDLAQVFISQKDYKKALDIICAEQGTISEDGDKWIDKYSGYTIRSIDLDIEEGFDESGYKLQTRELLEDDAGNILLQSSNVGQKETKTLLNPTIRIIQNVVNALSQQMGININDQLDFIIKYVEETQRLNIPSEKDYNAAVEKAKKRGEKKRLPSYEEATDSSLLILIFVFYLVAIQISIPSIKTLKTFPGCIKSFSGYPMDGKTDKTALTYIACVVNKISSSVKPWNSIYKLKESSIIKKMENIIEEYVLPNQEIVDLFKKKHLFLSLETNKIIPDSLNINLWYSFLPPLLPIKIKDTQTFTPAFKDELASSIKTGRENQIKSINVIKTKIITFSLLIQENIQKIINTQKPLLSSSNGDPFLENSCCNSTKNTIDFFIDANPDILKFNEQVTYLSDILYDIMIMVYPPLYFDPINTKHVYPEINPEFSENVIYKAFIYYCKFATNLPIDEELRAICSEKPTDITSNMTLEEQIKLLKLNGKTFSTENFNQLIMYISRNNIINLNFSNTTINNFVIIKDIVQYFNEKDSSIFPKILLNKLSNLLDSYDLVYNEDSEDIRDIKNYLSRENELLEENINEFMTKYSKLNKSKLQQLKICIKNLCNFQEDNINKNINKIINFGKQSLYNLISVFPNIVINKIDYESIIIPKHWMLSEKHMNDIKVILKQYYSGLTLLYNDEQINMVLLKIQDECKDILRLVDKLFYQVNIFRNGKELYSVFDNKILKQIILFMYYSVLNKFINLSKDVEILSSKILKKDDEDLGIEPDYEDEAQDIISGEQKLLANKVSEIIYEFINIICASKDVIDLSYENVMERVLRSKEKEKTQITDYLKYLTDEEREIENLFKNSKLERWNKGLQKGLTQYVKETYDEERDKIEQQAILEQKLGVNDLVTNMNKDIYMLDLLTEEAQQLQDNIEQYDITDLPDDDDYGDRDIDDVYGDIDYD